MEKLSSFQQGGNKDEVHSPQGPSPDPHEALGTEDGSVAIFSPLGNLLLLVINLEIIFSITLRN